MFGQEFAAHIGIFQALTHEKMALVEARFRRRRTVNGKTGHAGGGDLHKARLKTQGQIHQMAHTAQVHIADGAAYGKVRHVGRAVDDGVWPEMGRTCHTGQSGGVRDVAFQRKEALAEEPVKGVLKIIVENLLEAFFHRVIAPAPQQAAHGVLSMRQKTVQHVRPQKARGPGKQHMPQRPAWPRAESFQRVARQQAMDGRIVPPLFRRGGGRGPRVSVLAGFQTGGQGARRGMGKNIRIGHVPHMQAIGLTEHTGHRQG